MLVEKQKENKKAWKTYPDLRSTRYSFPQRSVRTSLSIGLSHFTDERTGAEIFPKLHVELGRGRAGR